jgi:hypothetical protein
MKKLTMNEMRSVTGGGCMHDCIAFIKFLFPQCEYMDTDLLWEAAENCYAMNCLGGASGGSH